MSDSSSLPIVRLENPVREYDWGSHRAIAELRGEPVPSARPQAELWMGAHPLAPSRVVLASGEVSLLTWIERQPVQVLGARVCERFGARLPFLFKVLAAESPLSIQAHPDADQARDGFARENERGIPLSHRTRNYRDASHKPELICALSSFSALCGFRRLGPLRALLERLGAADLTPVGEGGDALRGFFRGLLEMEPDRRAARVAEIARAAGPLVSEDPAFSWLVRLQETHPGDPGVLAPLYLNPVELEPGQAMFLSAGELHCYLRGVAIELMANSDNVLRGGLTSKHVDPGELMSVLQFRESRVEVLEPSDPGPRVRYDTPAREFVLSRLRIREGEPFESADERSVEMLLCTEGEIRIAASRGEPLALRQGESGLIPAAAGRYRVEGRGTAYCAGVPD
jgi:mannose-6-phosphate isomerase